MHSKLWLPYVVSAFLQQVLLIHQCGVGWGKSTEAWSSFCSVHFFHQLFLVVFLSYSSNTINIHFFARSWLEAAVFNSCSFKTCCLNEEQKILLKDSMGLSDLPGLQEQADSIFPYAPFPR